MPFRIDFVRSGFYNGHKTKRCREEGYAMSLNANSFSTNLAVTLIVAVMVFVLPLLDSMTAFM